MSKRSAAEIEAHLAAPVAGQLKLDLAVGSREALFSRSRGSRVRRRRGKALPAGVVYVGRPSVYGNPFRCDGSASARRRAVEQYRVYLLDRPNLVDLVRATRRA